MENKPKKKSNKKILILVFLSVLLVSLVSVGLISAGSNPPSSSSINSSSPTTSLVSSSSSASSSTTSSSISSSSLMSVTITFDTNGGSVINPLSALQGTAITAPSNPTRTGYTFAGWFSDEALTNAYTFPATMPSSNVTVYAKWTINQYTITLNTNDGTSINSITQDLQHSLNAPVDPTRTGYTFAGWFSDEALTNAYTFPATMPSSNITVYAKWTINQYTITFDTNGGTSINSITQDFNTSLTAPVDPTRTGYTFAGWFSDEALTNAYTFPATMPSSNVTVYAKWTINQYTITFDTNGGTSINPITQDFNTSLTAPVDPTRTGYTFAGWFSDEALTNAYTFPATMPSSNITIYAKWTINEYTITYRTFDSFNPASDFFLSAGETITQVEAGTFHTIILTSMGRVLTTGYQSQASLVMVLVDRHYRTKPTDITSRFNLNATINERIVQVVAGRYHSGAISSTGRVFTWGRNTEGQGGVGNTTNQNVPNEITPSFGLVGSDTIVSLELGLFHSVALSSTGRVFTMGASSQGQLGNGTTTPTSMPLEITNQFTLNTGETVTSVYAGNNFSGALSSDGNVFMWGGNESRQIGGGDGLTSNALSPVNITTRFNLDAEDRIQSLSLGHNHASAISEDGKVFMWGSNINQNGAWSGQIGLDSNSSLRNSPLNITNAFNLNPNETIQSMSLGSYYSSALTSTHRVFTWGLNDFGQLGNGTQGLATNTYIPVNITSRFTLTDNEVVTGLNMGYISSFALTSTGRVFAWGHNGFGQFGNGNGFGSLTPIATMSGSPSTVSNVTHAFGSVLTQPVDPVQSGKTFDGWYIDTTFTTKYTFATMPAQNITLYARWI
jgi:uncharacterized repeat protein (TIGR02543 family)